MKIFYSWQLDTDASIGKSFIREALDKAQKQLTESVEIEERIEIDQDTKDILGSPPIAEMIFKKIEECTIFVADVTLTGATVDRDKKKQINSNVAIELGYALGKHDFDVLLLVMNTKYGSFEELPFDLKHRRKPVEYELDIDTSKEDKKGVRNPLATELAGILKRYLPTPPAFQRQETTINPASYWKNGKYLFDDRISNGPERTVKYKEGEPLAYLRIWPGKTIEEMPWETLCDRQLSEFHIIGGIGIKHGTNLYGAISFCSLHDDLIGSTQLFKSGEIWAICRLAWNKRNGDSAKYIDVLEIMKDIHDVMIENTRRASKHVGYPSYIHIEFGMVNVEGHKIPSPGALYGPQIAAILRNEFDCQIGVDTNEKDWVKKIDREIVKSIYNAASTTVPGAVSRKIDNFPVDW